MCKQDLIAGAACAVASFGLILALSTPPRLDATEPVLTAIAPLATSELIANGVTITLALAGQTSASEPMVVQPDFKPQLTLVARNTTDHAIEIRPKVTLQSRSLADRLSRVPTTPSELWQYEQPALIAAGETRTFTLSPDVRLAPASTVQAIISLGSQRIVPVNFSVAGPADPTKVASR